MSDAARTSGRRLIPGRDLHIIGCRRPEASPSAKPCLGIRWAARIELGFPSSGYRVSRRPLPGGSTSEIGTFFLPDTSSWPAFAADAKARKPRCGPWFDAVEEKDFGELLPIIRLCDPRISAAEAPGLIERASDFFGRIHESDPALSFQFWRFGPVPKLAELLFDPLTAAAIERFYRRQSLALLLILALRFEYAALLGLASDDRPGEDEVVYRVEATFAGSHGAAESDPIPTNAPCDPPPPAWVTAERVPGTVGYPAAAIWPGWSPPVELSPTDEDGNPLADVAGWPRVPSALTALSWAEPAAEPKLIGHGPVLYRVGRHDHGAATAALLTSPALPTNAVFTAIGEGEDIIRGHQAPHLIDAPGMPWPPLEGHYSYELRGVDLLGVASSQSTRSNVRHHRDLPPPAPRAANAGEPVIALAQGASYVEAPLRINWTSGEDFGAPQVAEFRVASSFRAVLSHSLLVEGVADAGPLHADLQIASIPVAADALKGGVLGLPNGDFPIVAHTGGAHASLRVRKPLGRLPALGAIGLASALGPPGPVTRIARLARRPMVPASIAAIVSLAPLELELAPATAAAIPDDEALVVYIHLLGTSLKALRTGPQTFRIEPPRADTPADDRWTEWRALAAPEAALAASPILCFPTHDVIARVALPTGFTAGALSLHVTAADDADYVASPVLPVADPALANSRGNESGRATVSLSVRSLAPPAPVVADPFDPERRLWARSAANYSEDAAYHLSWPAAAGAARYEVWRALEGDVPGATRATPDPELRSLGESAGRFNLRSDQVFAPDFEDAIPGRAPVRALYRVRAVSSAGVPGSFSGIIGPVHVPDVRPPAAPNLLRVVPLPPADAPNAILVEWAAVHGAEIRFEIWHGEAGDPTVRMERAGLLAAGALPDGDGRFRFIHEHRPPGRLTAYEVRSVREALDPIDPFASGRRDVAGVPSRRLTAAALRSSALLPPVLSVPVPSTEGVLLSWALADLYDAIEIRRRSPERFAFEVIARLAGDAVSFTDPGAASGVSTYQLRAFGCARVATSDEATAELA